MTRTDTAITSVERDELSLSLDGAGCRELDTLNFCSAAIAAYDEWLAESGRVYGYTGDLDADIYATFGGEVGYDRVRITGDATVAATPKAKR